MLKSALVYELSRHSMVAAYQHTAAGCAIDARNPCVALRSAVSCRPVRFCCTSRVEFFVTFAVGVWRTCVEAVLAAVAFAQYGWGDRPVGGALAVFVSQPVAAPFQRSCPSRPPCSPPPMTTMKIPAAPFRDSRSFPAQSS
jgi:hypothetical protein